MVKKLLGDAVREERLRRNLSQNSPCGTGKDFFTDCL